jgi:hypothetical protein
MDLVRAVAELDQAPDLHAARILVLLQAFSEGNDGGPIEGITKLAKLDFLIRYPVMLEHALVARGRQRTMSSWKSTNSTASSPRW